MKIKKQNQPLKRDHQRMLGQREPRRCSGVEAVTSGDEQQSREMQEPGKWSTSHVGIRKKNEWEGARS